MIVRGSGVGAVRLGVVLFVMEVMELLLPQALLTNRPDGGQRTLLHTPQPRKLAPLHPLGLMAISVLDCQAFLIFTLPSMQ